MKNKEEMKELIMEPPLFSVWPLLLQGVAVVFFYSVNYIFSFDYLIVSKSHL